MMYFKRPISDCHVHLFDRTRIDECLAMVEFCGYKNWSHLAWCSGRHKAVTQNLMGALLKLKTNGKCLSYASFHYDKELCSADEFLRQIKLFDSLGFDGMKMLDGKPQVRRRMGLPLDAPNYDKMFDYACQRQFPLLYHINDPIEFWYRDRMPQWAKGKDEFYGDGTYQHKYEIDAETFGFLHKHPNLKICIPHFFFISDQPGLCSEMFETYPNLYFDITPGWEMFENFAKDYEFWRAFFKKYSYKILYGTDTFSDHWKQTVSCLRRVMETDEEFTAFEENCKGLKLDDATLDDIYYHNYYKFNNYIGKKMDVKGILDYADSLYAMIKNWDEENEIKDDIAFFKTEISKFQ